MDHITEWICRQNIDRFRREIAETADEMRRARLEELMAREKAQLERLVEQQQHR